MEPHRPASKCTICGTSTIMIDKPRGEGNSSIPSRNRFDKSLKRRACSNNAPPLPSVARVKGTGVRRRSDVTVELTAELCSRLGLRWFRCSMINYTSVLLSICSVSLSVGRSVCLSICLCPS